MNYDETKEVKINPVSEDAHDPHHNQKDPTENSELQVADQEIEQAHREGKYPSFDPEIADQDQPNPFGENSDPKSSDQDQTDFLTHPKPNDDR